ncbi:MAG: hypothetical protein KAQ73_01585, partial [Dehalococcoidia bacterium]|nr:hypothetical protein [Dehalococcoidia bacterium]
ETGGVLYASFVYYNDVDVTGVARYLTPAEDKVCKDCGDWDYLVEGLTVDEEEFDAWPHALKICGCLTPDSNTRLFAIDAWAGYDMEDYEYGAVWTFQDCYSKGAPDITTPADGETIAAGCTECESVPITFRWDRMCDACSYNLQIALDEDFMELVTEIHIGGDDYEEGDAPSYMEIEDLMPEYTYYWRVQAADAETGQYIRSWWSETQSFTIAPGRGAGVNLIAPEGGATGLPVGGIGFSWSDVTTADEYDFVLSANADLSSPIATEEGLTGTAAAYTGTLDYETPYFWQVMALKDGAVISTSTLGTFTTVAEGEEPVTPEPLATPVWVWVIIAIGAVLVIVVIVL